MITTIRRLLPGAGVIVLCALLSSVVLGQEYRGRIQGTVMDSSRAVIAGATVTLLNSKTGVSTVQATVENGRYLFDLVEPGTYRVTVEARGFNKFVLDNIAVPSRADLTVDAELKPGDITETVSVTAEASTLQLNTSKLEINVNQQLVESLPQLHRNAFLLAQLDPAVMDTTGSEAEPYHSWASNNQRIGGSQSLSNDLQVDGSPSGISVKTGYVPTPAMVQEVNIQQNVVDAEFGHSSGSAISVVLKAGTNEYHGLAFYQGQYPWLNALENRVYRTVNQTRNHMYGGTFSSPILKNRLFNFVSYEGWEQTQPGMLYSMLPTDLQRQGNFSQTLTDSGQLRPIYDPWSTATAPDGTITRAQFPGNIIPSTRIDPIAAKYIGALWKPNSPGIDAFGTNNFVASTPLKFPYKNFSDRVDYQVNEKLRLFGRISMFRTPVSVMGNPTGSDIYQSDRGSDRNATSYAGDATYTINPRTVLNLHGGYHNFVDASHFVTDFPSEWNWENLWPNSDFYKTVFADPNIPKLLPRMSVCNQYNWPCTAMGPGGGLWDERPHAWEFSGKISQQRGAHYLKAGADIRRSTTNSLLMLVNPGFGFDGKPTSETYNNPNLLLSGDPWATFLLGAIVPTDLASWGSNGNWWDSGATGFPVNIVPSIQSRFYGVYLNDDWKVTSNLTLNLGLRYEYESAFHDEQNRETRALDLNQAIPELQSITMPDDVKQFYGGSWKMNGAFQFADDDHRGAWDGGWGTLSPRIGAAYRLNDKTVLRGAYARYVTPWTTNERNQLSGTPLYGFSNFTGAPSEIQGVPQMQLSNPFPASNPIAPSYGKSLGIYTMLGDGLTYFSPERARSNSDRINISVQRRLPGSTILDVTYYLNRTSQVTNTSYNINQVDPEIYYTYKEETLAVMPNPFYDQFPVEKFPGPLRYQPEVSVASMAKLYPHYGDIYVVDGLKGGAMKYQALQMKLTKNYSHGLSVLAGYSYSRETREQFYDDIAYYNRNFSWQKASGENTYRHRLTAAGAWDVPVGKGRAFMPNANPVVDAILGGWRISGMMFWRSGDLLGFGTMLWDGTDPVVSDPGPHGWFNTSVFQKQPNYTKRGNPWDFDGVMGPGQFNMDASLLKEFAITEKVRFQLRVDSFNVVNNMSWNNPSTSVTDSNFGRSTDQKAYTFGRRTQLGMRLEF